MKCTSFVAACVTAVLAVTSSAAGAQGFPNRTLKIVVPYPAGGIVDLMARSVTEGLSARLGQSVIVENKPGASSSIGTETVANAEPDGYTILLTTLAFAVTPNLVKVPWSVVDDFEGVAHMGVVANIVAVTPSLGPTDLASFVALAKSKPGINYMNPGNGSSPHVSAELLQQVNDIKLTSVNYKGVPPSIPDFLNGTVPFGFFPFATIASHIRTGKARAIAIASPVRHKQFPDVPTMTEQGFKSSQVNSWYAFAVPKKTPRDVIDRLNKEFNAVLADPAVEAKVEKLGGSIVAGWTPEQTTRMFADESVRWAQVIKKAGIQAQ